ncbi:hypothetical protein CgunFtcFv8_012453 [Champsocephalus gunnari]|uniref:Uncharacterized protein n=1 Tax=Champsocephalus gunnari TaxID=52237 RepID=A0AAN8HTR9_CHAGU|nr:hypothetical protein CgunFtcFv8_012453 [Champsocephalus gunnari]
MSEPSPDLWDPGRPEALHRVLQDVKSPCLQSALQDKEPELKRRKIDLIFKDVLKLKEEKEEEEEEEEEEEQCGGKHLLQIKKIQEEEEGPSTSSCSSCVKLRKRIVELEEELSQLRGGRGGPSNILHSGAPPPRAGPRRGLCRWDTLL